MLFVTKQGLADCREVKVVGVVETKEDVEYFRSDLPSCVYEEVPLLTIKEKSTVHPVLIDFE